MFGLYFEGSDSKLCLNGGPVAFAYTALTPDDGVARVRAIVAAFAAVPQVAVAALDGTMREKSHLRAAPLILSRASF